MPLAMVLCLGSDGVWADSQTRRGLKHRIAEVEHHYRNGNHQLALEKARVVHEQVSAQLTRVDSLYQIATNNLAVLLELHGELGEAEKYHREVLQIRRDQLGHTHRSTLDSMSNLANLLARQGRYKEAEDRYREALELYRSITDENDRDLLSLRNGLARLYHRRGRYHEAEDMFGGVLDRSRARWGERDALTLTLRNNMAGLYSSLGRYGEAEDQLRTVLKTYENMRQERHPRALAVSSNIAFLHVHQGRYDEAARRFEELLAVSRGKFSDTHHLTLTSLNNLAYVYARQERYDKAEPLYSEALATRRAVSGATHPKTLTSMNNLAGLYADRQHYDAAEKLYREVLETRRREAGQDDPLTLTSMHNLALLLTKRRQYGEAEQLYRGALKTRGDRLDDENPATLSTSIELARLLIETGRFEEAARRLNRIGPRLLRWAGGQLQSTRQARVKRLLLNRQSRYQNIVLDLARRNQGGDLAVRLAADVVLRWKGMAGDEEAYLARLMHRTRDPRLTDLAREIQDLRAALATSVHKQADDADQLLARLEMAESRLSALSLEFRKHKEFSSASASKVEQVLPEGAVLIEFRLYEPFDYRRRRQGDPRIAVIRLSPDANPAFADLGPVAEIAGLMQRLDAEDGSVTQVENELFQRLFEPFADDLRNARHVYLAPDGILYQLPFTRLRPKLGGKRWIETTTLRVVQSGRALLHRRGETARRGLVAFGGVDFDDIGTPLARSASREEAGPDDGSADVIRGAGRAVRQAVTRFKPLEESGSEVDNIARRYAENRIDDPVKVWTSGEARERRLKTLVEPPRVLHLATHGFYLSTDAPVERPMLLSGLSVAGANLGLAGNTDPDGEDGILYGLEAMGLNLQGTELVALSACDTAKGTIDYAEGVYGLGRAFRIAGADNVLITLWSLGDALARDFMTEFYIEWLTRHGDPAMALAVVQKEWASSADPARADPQAWAPYILVQNGR